MRNLQQKVVTILIVVYLFTLFTQTYIIYSATGLAIAAQSQQQGTIGLTLLAPTIFLFEGHLNTDNQSIDLNWTNVSNALYYTVYYSENISAIATLNLGSIPSDVYNFSNITFLNYTDSTANQNQKRYYTASYTDNFGETLTSDVPVGKATYYYDIFNSTTYGLLASNRMALFLDSNYTAETFLQEIPGTLNPTLSKLDKSDGSGEYITTHVRGLADGNDFQMSASEGYLLTVNNFYNQTLVGDVTNPPYIIYYNIFNSTTYGLLASNWKGIYDTKKNYTAEVFLQEIPGGLNPTISELRKSDGSGEYLVTHVRGLADGNDFQMSISKHYIVTVNNNYNHTLCNSTSNCFG